jgi:amino acid permease
MKNSLIFILLTIPLIFIVLSQLMSTKYASIIFGFSTMVFILVSPFIAGQPYAIEENNPEQSLSKVP